jgi:hypothetical protein
MCITSYVCVTVVRITTLISCPSAPITITVRQPWSIADAATNEGDDDVTERERTEVKPEPDETEQDDQPDTLPVPDEQPTPPVEEETEESAEEEEPPTPPKV